MLHFDAATGATRGILLADAFKAALAGQNLTADVARQMEGSRFLRQYCANAPRWLCRPDELGETGLTFAAEPQPLPGRPVAGDPAGATEWQPAWTELPVRRVLLRGGAVFAVAPISESPPPLGSVARTLTLWRGERATPTGAPWQQVYLPVERVNDVAAGAGDPHLLSAAGDGGIYRSVDGGATWSHVLSPRGALSGTGIGLRVVVSPAHANLVYAATVAATPGSEGPQGRGAWRSLDGGATWRPLLEFPGPVAPAPETAPAAGGQLSALAAELPPLRRLIAGLGGGSGRGVLGSDDGGASWAPVGT